MSTRVLGLFAIVIVACGGGSSVPAASDTHEESPAPEPTAPAAPSPTTPTETPAAAPPLLVKFLGVGGFLIEVGTDSVLTAPLYTRPTFTQVLGGQAVSSNDAIVAKDLTAAQLTSIRTILAGHAHYDHLLDVPGVMQRAPNATLYSNASAKHLLAAYAPDRAASCNGTPASASPIARSRVFAFDDAASSVVDYRSCPSKKPAGAPLQGTWVKVPGANVRVLAICSDHPDAFGPVHFAPGDVTEDACVPPPRMDAWKEGATLTFLVDFLDANGKPIHRVYYEDAPTAAPTGIPPADVLAEKRVDVAILTLGASNNVSGAPTTTIEALRPRYTVGGHWEDFFLSSSGTPQPIAFLDVEAWKTKARAAMPAAAEPSAMKHNGSAATERAIVPQPGDWFQVAP